MNRRWHPDPWQRLGLGWLAGLGAAALAAPWLPMPFAPAALDLSNVSVSPAAGAAGHWLGTDPLGRDVLANLLFGARTVLTISLPAALLTALLGGLLGSVAGFWRNALRVPLPLAALAVGLGWWALALPWPGIGWAWAVGGLIGEITRRLRHNNLITKNLIQNLWPSTTYRIPLPIDALVLGAAALFGAVPRLVLVLALAAGERLTPAALLALLTLTSWPAAARLVRAEMLRVRALPFVDAAHGLGLPAGRVWWHHALPQALRPLRTDFPLSLAAFVGLESTLSFLGLGLPPETASWGRLLSAARLDPSAWWTAAAPIAALLLTTAALRSLSRPPHPSKQPKKAQNRLK